MKFAKSLEKIVNIIVTILFIIITIITFVQVITRYFMGISYFWAEELSRFSMVWITFLGATIAVSSSAHTRIDFFINLLPEKLKKFINIFDEFICMFFSIVISIYSIDTVKIAMKNVSTGLKLPMGFVYGALPFAGLFMALYFILRIYLRLKDVDIEGGIQ